MHSVRRVRTTAEQQAARRKKEAGEIVRYNRLNDAVLARDTDAEAFARTTQLLLQNPEHYTIWNIRRELLSAAFADPSFADQKAAKLVDELKLTQSLLPGHPKVYWIWNHRRWVLAELAKDKTDIWHQELALVTKMLEKDPRNFHAWAYRRWVVVQSGSVTPEQELAYTTKKINENFSNFSAWHYRSQLMPVLSERPSLRQELDYVYGAVAMDPEDSSGWIYYQWLLYAPLFREEIDDKTIEHEKVRVQELWDEEPSVWAGRLLCDIRALQGEPVDPALLTRMAELDPLRRQAYKDLAKHENI